MPSALETGWLLANQFDATLEGVPLRPAFSGIVAADPIVAVSIPPPTKPSTSAECARPSTPCGQSSDLARQWCTLPLARRFAD